MADDIAQARRRMYDRVRSMGCDHGEASHRAEAAIRTADTQRNTGVNPGPGDKKVTDDKGRVIRPR